MRDAFFHLLRLAYFMAPAYCANMAPPFVRFWRGWNRPISRRWLGDHKTVVGFLASVYAGVLTTAMQRLVDAPIALIDYRNWFAVGLLFGAGAMLGDALKSFAKRRLGIPPGDRWIPFDQLDFVLGALILVAPWAKLGWPDIAVILALSFAADVVVNRLSYRCGIKDSPW
jgi:CDP-2,3-bis-(O-geranylgeranyl)-sn-glycerol synthase